MNIDNCFDGIIGVKGCHNTQNAVLWVNDIEGMSNELMDKIADGDQETFYDVFKKCRTNAINQLKHDIKDVLLRATKRVKLNETIYKSEKAMILRPIESNEFSETKIGILFTTADSKYIIGTFNSISIYPLVTTNCIAKLVDYETNEVLYESLEEIALEANKINTIPINRSIDSDNHRAIILVLERQSSDPEFNLAKLSCNRFKETKCKSCGPCESFNGYGQATINQIPHELVGLDQNNEFAIYPFVSEDLNDLWNFTAIENFICVGVDIICSIEEFICQNASELGYAVTNKIAANILGEKMAGFRINNMAKGNLEYTKDLKDELNKTYRKVLELSVPNLPLDDVSMCWECDNKVGVYHESMI
jgi:hypothetical protein